MISYVITTFNRFELTKCLSYKLSRQLHKNDEIIIVDDCSDSLTYLALLDFTKNNDSIRLLRTQKNFGGPALPRNIGIAAAKNNWISILDSDDHIFDNRGNAIHAAIDEIQKNDIGVEPLCIYHKMIGSKNKKIYGGEYPDREILFWKLYIFSRNKIPLSSLVLNKKLFDRPMIFPEDRAFISIEDSVLNIEMALSKKKLYFIGQVLGEYNQAEPDSLSRDFRMHLRMSRYLYSRRELSSKLAAAGFYGRLLFDGPRAYFYLACRPLKLLLAVVTLPIFFINAFFTLVLVDKMLTKKLSPKDQ
jgi:glycosyltransferase involved in cell wall biosynthesis